VSRKLVHLLSVQGAAFAAAQALRDRLGFSFPKADWVVHNLPTDLCAGMLDQDAQELADALRQAGVEVELRDSALSTPMLVFHPAYDRDPPRTVSHFEAPGRRIYWVLEDRLGGMGRPSQLADLAELARHGVKLLVSLSHMAPPSEVLHRMGIESLHVPVPDFGVPTDEQVDTCVAHLQRVVKGGGRAVVHCGAGLGRTGTMLACYLVATGQSPEQAITRVRQFRPGAIETCSQEEFVSSYAVRARALAAARPPTQAEPAKRSKPKRRKQTKKKRRR